jgi:uncharacterized protein (TIGR02391 family)
MSEPALEMSFDPNTIEHLGVRMYSTLPPVIAELVANSYDADASRVSVRLFDNNSQKKIIVEDDGTGMSFDDINQKFLHIGRNRRHEEGLEHTNAGRPIIGKKGLGKLSFFGISKEIEVQTTKDGIRTIFVMKWSDIKNSSRVYSPTIVSIDEVSKDDHGTKITLNDVERESIFSAEDLAISLSKIFIIPEGQFEVLVSRNEDDVVSVNNDSKFSDIDIEFEWKVPEEIMGDYDFEFKGLIRGKLIASKKPISPKTNMRGIVLYSRGKLVNTPEYFSDSTSSHFFSYLTGWLEVDFIDELEMDVISTDRKSLVWDHPVMSELRLYLRSLIRKVESAWRDKRAAVREQQISEDTGINLPAWLEKLPSGIRDSVQPLITALVKDSELDQEVNNRLVRKIHNIVPEYPLYHWRQLHPEIKRVSEKYYTTEDYYSAFQESVKHYTSLVRVKSASVISDDSPMMENVFSLADPVLSVTENFKKPDGTEFSPETIKNIKNAQSRLSTAIILGGRNVVAHEEHEDLRVSKLFTEEDCLDALSLLSHLLRRLDASVKVK